MQLFLFLFPLQHTKRPDLQNKQVRVLRMAFRARKVFGAFEKRDENKKGGNLICAARKNGGSSEQAFAPSFLPSPEAKEKAKIQKKVLDKGYISKPFFNVSNPKKPGLELFTLLLLIHCC